MQDSYIDEELVPYFDIDWIAVQGNDIDAVVDALGLDSLRQGSFSNFGETANTFVYLYKSDWLIIIHIYFVIMEKLQRQKNLLIGGNRTLFPGSLEVIKIAQKWSIEPIYNAHPSDTEGVLGCYILCDD